MVVDAGMYDFSNTLPYPISVFDAVTMSIAGANMAYDIAAVKLFGIEARLNFPNLLNDYISDKIHPIRKKRGDYAKIRKGLL